MPHCCPEMTSHVSNRDIPVVYNDRFREYGIQILDGGTAVQLIAFCPWCGTVLPASLRDRWFDRLFALGLEPEDPRLPEEMKSDEWWRQVEEKGSGKL